MVYLLGALNSGSVLREVRRLALLASLAWCSAGEPTLEVDLPIVLTQIPRSAPASPAQNDPLELARQDRFDGARIVLLAPGRSLRVLSPGFHSAADPNLSCDGRSLLFAGRKEPADRWRIWEVGLDGQGLRPVSPEHLDARSPIHVSALFTLDSPEPWFTMVFVGRNPTRNEMGRPSASSLYNLKLDGTELRQLTFNPNRNFDPFQMWDGRVIYSAERYPNQPGASGPRIGLYAIHIEGADIELFGGELGRSVQHMACATDRGLVVFVEPEPGTPDGAGHLASVEESRPHVTYRTLTQDSSGLFLYPSPLRGNVLLVSRRPAQGPDTCGLFRFDADQGRCAPVFDSPDFHEVQAVAATPRPRPDGHSTVVETRFDTGTFYGLNCYDSDRRMAPHVSTGQVKRVRFIEGLVQSAATPTPHIPPSPFVPRRLIGEAPVEPDGSFNVEVPADTPLLLQTLDERGLALANCGWIWVKPRETRGCIGCHEDPERVPENEYVLALRRPANRLVLPPSQRRTIAFRTDIAPLLRTHCATADCHGNPGSPLPMPLTADAPSQRDLELAYTTLLAPHPKPPNPTHPPLPGKYVDPGRARTSLLVWRVAGLDTSKPWDRIASPTPAAPEPVRLMPPPGRDPRPTAEAIRTVIQWIDLGAQFDAPSAPSLTNPPPRP